MCGVAIIAIVIVLFKWLPIVRLYGCSGGGVELPYMRWFYGSLRRVSPIYREGRNIKSTAYKEQMKEMNKHRRKIQTGYTDEEIGF